VVPKATRPKVTSPVAIVRRFMASPLAEPAAIEPTGPHDALMADH